MSSDRVDSVPAFLAELGLEQYGSVFEDQAISFELLPELTEVQLEQLGVKALGHRLKIRRAAAALATRGAAPLPTPDPVPAPAAPVPPLPASAERRQITVMFCDLVGSTALSQRLDAEDLRLLMQKYQEVAGEVVRRNQGNVAQYLGDGLMVYFGWPRAHEDDAVRAVHTALQVIEAVKGIQAAEPARVRIGIATGSVVVGQGSEGDPGAVRMAVGETPNLAARVQAMAEPDQVVVAPGTRRLLGDSFECVDLGEHTLKGIAAPARLWRVLGESLADGRFAASSGTLLTALVNRDLELSLLLDRWARARDGQGQAVLLAGEPGIGKSRVLAELCTRVPEHSVLFRLQCSDLHGNSAFYPIKAQVLRATGIDRVDPPELRLDKIEAWLAAVGPAVLPTARHFAALLSLPLDRYEAFQASPAKVKQGTIEALVQVVMEVARRRPVLLLAEDLHWMDPSSLEAMDALIAELRRAKVLLVMTARTAMASRWGAQPQVTSFTMVGLSHGHSLQLATSVAAAHGLTERIIQRIVEHTDGVPLFLEELTRTVAEGSTWRNRPHADTIEIPSTLQASLTARLDQLGPARRVAQLGALMGRQFRHAPLSALHGGTDEELALHLEQLIASGLVSRSGSVPEAIYTFHHALIQDAAYDSLLKSERRILHARAADILREQFAELAEFEPELLARHYTAGEAWDQAVPLWLKAGRRAWARSAVKEAIAHVESGLAVVDKVSDPSLRDQLELGLQSTLGVVYFAAVSYAAPQAQAAFARATELCERIPDAALKGPVLYGVGAFQTMKGDTRAGHLAFERLRIEADASGQPHLQLHAHALLTWSSHNLAEFKRSVAEAERVRLLARAGAMEGPRLGAADPRVISECFRAVSLWALGQVDQARDASEELVVFARGLNDPYSLVYTLSFAALLVPELRREYERVHELAEEGLNLAVELGYGFMELSGRLRRAWARACLTDDVAVALADIDAAQRRVDMMGTGYSLSQQLARRARLLLRLGDIGAAQLAVAQALGQVEASSNLFLLADVYLAEGEVLLAHGGEQRALAEAAFRMALEVAQQQGARSWQLRASLALARLAIEDDGPAAVRRLLQPVLAGFTEGHGTADLKEAARLLARAT